MKKRFQILFFLLVVVLAACDKPVVPKPEKLIREKDMINMLVDVHLAEASYSKFRYDTTMRHNSSVDFYYSVLAKYQVPDSVFEQSYVYYASQPRNFEKMYRKVMNRLSEMEQDFSGRKKDLLEFDELDASKKAK